VSAFGFLRERIDLVDVAGQFTALRPSGRAYFGRCPYPGHRDESPSFYIYPDSRFYCYGCRSSGDVTDLWSGVKGVEAGIAAALDLAREFGVELPSANPEEQRQAEERRRLEAEYFGEAEEAHDALRRHRHVAAWWEGRGFDDSLRQRFLLGARDGNAVIPFWNRGRVESFILRRLQGEPKYELQRAEKFVWGFRPLFIPGPAHGEVFLVEGYVDALALAALGYPAAAIGGTGMSDRQLEELRALRGPIYILPDADESGKEAAQDWVQKLYPKALLCAPSYEREADRRGD
jgi:DNA primase